MPKQCENKGYNLPFNYIYIYTYIHIFLYPCQYLEVYQLNRKLCKDEDVQIM